MKAATINGKMISNHIPMQVMDHFGKHNVEAAIVATNTPKSLHELKQKIASCDLKSWCSGGKIIVKGKTKGSKQHSFNTMDEVWKWLDSGSID